MGKFTDLTGQRFIRWFILEFVGMGEHRQSLYRCLCDCGNIRIIRGSHLLSGATKSCGCLNKEIARIIHTIHGRSRTRAYHAWYNMIERCYHKNHPAYKNYGGRNILVCERWLHSFENFFFDMCTSRGLEDVPEGLSLDRIDNDSGYCNENCRWATRSEQNSNQRSRRIEKRWE